MNLDSLITDVGIIGAVSISFLNYRKIHSVHLELNSRLGMLIRTGKRLSRVQGISQGRKLQKAGK